jgi:signal peptide peptidase SppA
MPENPLSVFGGTPLAIDADYYDRPYGNQKPYAVENGIAVIDVCGALAKEPSWIERLIYGATSYAQIENQLELAGEDAEVKGIMLRINSPGGSVAGMFQTAAAIRAARKTKPVWAAADDIAASAAYLLASAAEKIYLPSETGKVGSIGIVAQRIDVTESDKREGIGWNFITAGRKKTFGNPHTPLTKEERADIQAEVDRIYGLFVDAVARYRSKLSPEAIRATEAGVYTGPDAVEAKLADKLGSFDDAMADFAAALEKKSSSVTASAATHSPQKEVPPMENEQKAADQNTGSVDVAAITAAAKAEGYAEATEVFQLCAIAGLPATKALEYVNAKTPAAEMRKTLVALRATAQEAASKPVDNKVDVAAGTSTDPAKAPGFVSAAERMKKRIGQ